VPDLGKNLFGISSLTDRGAIATFNKDNMTLMKNGYIVLVIQEAVYIASK